MKYVTLLIINCFFILYSIMFFTDHKVWPESTSAKLRNVLFLCTTMYVAYNVLFIYILKKEKEQNGIIYKIFSAIKNSAINSYTFIQPFQKEFIISLILAAVIIIVSFVLLGLPGGIIITALQKVGIFNRIEGDNIWPASIFISCLWPLCFPIATLAKNYLIQHEYSSYSLVGLCLSACVWIISIIIITASLFGKNA